MLWKHFYILLRATWERVLWPKATADFCALTTSVWFSLTNPPLRLHSAMQHCVAASTLFLSNLVLRSTVQYIAENYAGPEKTTTFAYRRIQAQSPKESSPQAAPCRPRCITPGAGVHIPFCMWLIKPWPPKHTQCCLMLPCQQCPFSQSWICKAYWLIY